MLGLRNFSSSLSITSEQAMLVRGDRRDGSYGSVRSRTDCAKDLWRNLPPIRLSACGPNQTQTFFQTSCVMRHFRWKLRMNGAFHQVTLLQETQLLRQHTL